MNILQKLFGKKRNPSESKDNVQDTKDELQVSKEQIESLEQGKPVVKEETVSQSKQPQVGGFNQETWDKVENMIKVSKAYLERNGEDIAMSVFKDFNLHNQYDIYKNGIVAYCKEIDKLEKRCNVNPACSNGCSYCCQ